MNAAVNSSQVPAEGGNEGARARQYNASGRRERAARNREAVLDAARQLLLRDGYASTTIAAVAKAAGVSSETVYKNFGGKAGLVRGVYERGLLGTGQVPAELRSDDAQLHEKDPQRLMESWGFLVAEILPRSAPAWILMRDAAAAGDADLVLQLDQIRDEKYGRMLGNARRLLASGHAKEGLTDQQAADTMWFYTSPELYEVLMLQRGWDADRLAGFVAAGLAAQLL
ncbi:helix-turn-helix domain-containing protein [Micrococcaceae bacterium Sec5.7]